jgi:integrase
MTADALRIARRDGRDMDAAIAGVLFQAALRRSEAAALEWHDIEPAQDVPGRAPRPPLQDRPSRRGNRYLPGQGCRRRPTNRR